MIIVAMVMSCTAMAARSVWYTTPVEVAAGRSTIDSVGVDAQWGRVHVRASGHKWGVRWNETSDGRYVEARLEIIPSNDILYSAVCCVQIAEYQDNNCKMIYTGELPDVIDADGSNSIKVTFGRDAAKVYVGSDVATLVATAPSCLQKGTVSIVADEALKCECVEVVSRQQPMLQLWGSGDEDELMEVLSASSDPIETVWAYLDSDIDGAMAAIGGRYKLATVSNGDGYDIVYLSGAKVNQGIWQPVTVKGVLTPSVFKDHYDLTWYSASGTCLNEDVYATFSDDYGILTLRFPVIKATLRFARLH